MTADASAGLPSTVIDELDAFLVELNGAAGGVILPLFRADHGLIDKGGAEGFHLTEVILGDRSVFLVMERRPGSDSIRQ